MTNFKEELEKCFADFIKLLSTPEGEWTVKGFIDLYKNIYTISIDTKVVSKIVELMIFPVIAKFADDNNLELVLSNHQNHYPDVTFINKSSGEKIALDLKSTYRTSPEKVNGMTLGAFTGYFRNRDSTKNITFPYQEYSKHFILGVIYSRTDIHAAELTLGELGCELNDTQRKSLAVYISNQSEDNLERLCNALKTKVKKEKIAAAIAPHLLDERTPYELSQLESITSVVRDFDFFVQEKWKIAIDRPGSGNTKNIGSANVIETLKEGTGLFTGFKNGKDVFDDFWTHYLTKDMAQAAGYDHPPYSNLESFAAYKESQKN